MKKYKGRNFYVKVFSMMNQLVAKGYPRKDAYQVAYTMIDSLQSSFVVKFVTVDGNEERTLVGTKDWTAVQDPKGSGRKAKPGQVICCDLVALECQEYSVKSYYQERAFAYVG